VEASPLGDSIIGNGANTITGAVTVSRRFSASHFTKVQVEGTNVQLHALLEVDILTE